MKKRNIRFKLTHVTDQQTEYSCVTEDGSAKSPLPIGCSRHHPRPQTQVMSVTTGPRPELGASGMKLVRPGAIAP